MRFHALDGLRGLCALTVALLHLYIQMQIDPPVFILHAFALVDFFFVLSGFVLAHAFFDSLALRGEGGAFVLRRVGRLYPLHLFMLGLFVMIELGRYLASLRGEPLLVPPFSGVFSLPTLLSNLALVQALNLHDGISWNFPAWSISVEFYTNLLFAAVLVLPFKSDGVRRKTQVLVLMAVFGGLATFFAARVSKDLTFDYGLPRCIYGFFLGAAVQRLRAAGYDPLARWPRPALAAVEALLALVVIAFLSFGEHFWMFMRAPPLFALVTLVYAREAGPVSGLLLTRPFQSLGEWSYSIYMVHVFLAQNVLGRAASLASKMGLFGLEPGLDASRALATFFTRGPLQQVELVIVYVALTLAASAVTYRFIERPGRSYFNALAAREKAPAAKAAPAL